MLAKRWLEVLWKREASKSSNQLPSQRGFDPRPLVVVHKNCKNHWNVSARHCRIIVQRWQNIVHIGDHDVLHPPKSRSANSGNHDFGKYRSRSHCLIQMQMTVGQIPRYPSEQLGWVLKIKEYGKSLRVATIPINVNLTMISMFDDITCTIVLCVAKCCLGRPSLKNANKCDFFSTKSAIWHNAVYHVYHNG